jgi:hypothetical protein
LAALRWLKKYNVRYESITIDETFDPVFPELAPDSSEPARESILLHITHHGFAGVNPPTFQGTSLEHFFLTKITGRYHFFSTYCSDLFVGEPVDPREKLLDVLSYPILFPSGRYGMHDASRQSKLSETQYVHNRMKHRDRRFVQNDSFVFFLANHSDIKAIHGSVNFNLKKNSKWGQPGANLVEGIMAKDPSLDANFGSFFTSLRGHMDYWRVRRDDLQAVMM